MEWPPYWIEEPRPCTRAEEPCIRVRQAPSEKKNLEKTRQPNSPNCDTKLSKTSAQSHSPKYVFANRVTGWRSIHAKSYLGCPRNSELHPSGILRWISNERLFHERRCPHELDDRGHAAEQRSGPLF